MREMAFGFLPRVNQDGTGDLEAEFRDATGAIAEVESIEDIIRSTPHEG